MSTAITATASTKAIRSKQDRTQNYLLIWIDSNIDQTNADCKNTLAQLRSVVSDVNLCTTPAQCIKCLNDIDDERAFVVSSGSFGQHLVPNIHSMLQLEAIYIFCRNKSKHEAWAKEWPKIQGVFTSIKLICDSLKKVARHCDHDLIRMSFISKLMNKMEVVASSQQNLDQLDPLFMYSMLFKEIVLEIEESDGEPLKKFVIYCRNKGINEFQLKFFQQKYYKKSAIWWYSYEFFLYSMLNHALRQFDMGTMAKMSFFIRNLHRQLEQLHKEQSTMYNKQFIVYRGQGLTQQDFKQLVYTKGGLLSFNNFLSTCTKPNGAIRFVQNALRTHENIVGVFFIITIDPSEVSTSTSPFAFIKNHSAFPQEEEILFSMHTVFRVGDTKQTVNNNRIWEVQLTFTGDNDPQLAALTQRMREEIDGIGWYRMGRLMHRLGHFNQVEELYNELLKDSSSYSSRAHIYHQLGWLKNDQGQYKEAALFYEKVLKISQKTLPEDHASLADTYNNMGQVYHTMGYYSKALQFYEKARKIYEKTLSPKHHSLATSYNNIGGVYDDMGDYSKALQLYDKSHKILEALPSNHPLLAASYNNIGILYNHRGDYWKALKFHEKALEIRRAALPSNHSNLADSYNNIGGVYIHMGDYSKALEFYEEAQKIYETTLPPNHPWMAATHLNFAAYYEKMGYYAAALKSLQNTFQILQKTFEEGNPAFSFIFNRLGRVYRSTKDYGKALDYFEKCLVIRQQTLPNLHPYQAITYSDIGDVRRLVGDHQVALSFHRKALNIQENVHCNPLECVTTYINFGETYREMEDYSTALSYFQKGLQICDNKLPRNHPDFAVIYHNLAKLYLATRQYNTAMENVQQAIEIAQQKLPSNHPHILDYRETFEKVRNNM